MSVSFICLSVLGIIVFFDAGDAPVGGLFIGLTLVYISDFFASLFAQVAPSATPGGPVVTSPPAPSKLATLSERGERALGFFHLGTGLWLIYLTFAVVLNIASDMHLLL